MNLKTRWGPLQAAEGAILTFVDGLPGLAHKRWLSHPVRAVEYLIAVDDPELVLATVDPRRLDPNYAPALEPSALATLGANADTPLDWRVIVRVAEAQVYANFFAPLLIHRALLRVAQMPLVGSRYGFNDPCAPP